MSPTVSTKTVKTRRSEGVQSEAELVDVMDTFQHAISIIEEEKPKNLAFLQKEIDIRKPNSIRTALTRRKSSRSRAFSEQS